MNIVLAHGFLGFQRRFGVHYFNGVAEFLRKEFAAVQLKVLATEVNPVGRVPERGKQLRSQVLQALANGALDPAEKVHLVGHSMGGLDSRWCVSPGNPDNIADRVASVSTISTPHRGSPVADILTGGRIPANLGPNLDPLLDWGGGVLDLTTVGAAGFNKQFPDHPEVRYLSYAGKGRGGSQPTCRLLWACHWLIRRSGFATNDGLVSVESAAWGESPETHWPADHAEEIGHDLDRGTKPDFDYLTRYRAIVERLVQG